MGWKVVNYIVSAYKDKKTGKWYLFFYYKDWQGQRKGKTKRGFKTKREALEWEREFLQKSDANLEMTFEAFVDIYTSDIQNRLKENTWLTKKSIIDQKILPYFKDKKLCDIKPADVIAWQNEIMSLKDKQGKVFSPTYLKTIHNQLSAIFNHAVRFYELKSNPARRAGNMGKERTKEMLFWIKDEYTMFSDAMMDKPISFYAFEILYWCGLRLGELLALTKEDMDIEKGTIRINKSYQRIKSRDVITEPKTPKSIRVVKMPDFLTEEIQEYMKSIYGIKDNQRLFPITKGYLHNEMKRGCKETGVKRIRVHDLRHSHVSLLIEMGFSAVAIADRVGHENIDITYRYAHLFPSKQVEIADKLSIERGEGI
ncbi:tyrosine-type recombinase/integrase [Anaeromicrobium sp.]|uniref:site-specific integrase n=1 Tax=Anaeromicrobium sp. TaxID=1929132 RepID=UPI003FA4D2D4